MTTLILAIILTISVFFFLLERILDFLNLKNLKADLPEELQGIYDAEKYTKSQQYERESSRFGFYSSTYSFLLTLLMLIFGGFGIFYDWIVLISTNLVLETLSFFALLLLISEILTFPFSYYSIFVIEEKYGFNKMNLKTFLLDKLKNLLVSGILGGLILAVIVWFYTLTQHNFWIYAWLIMTLFTVFMMMFYSSLIVPIFNKQTPLEAGELRSKIEEFSKIVNFKIENIFVIDGSKRSSKANAYFSGLGNKKRIVLYDTLINDLDTNELLAVLAHEVGHYKKNIPFGHCLFRLFKQDLRCIFYRYLSLFQNFRMLWVLKIKASL